MIKVLTKLAKVRLVIQNEGLKKSGKNKHLGFNYYELSDILPTVNRIFKEEGLLGNFSIIGESENGLATLTIYDIESGEHIDFTTPIAKATLRNATPVQELGAVHTYVKRYLYLNALELVEPDILDKTIGEKTESKASANQVKMIQQLLKPEHIYKACEQYNVKQLKDLTTKQASELIKRIQEKAKK